MNSQNISTLPPTAEDGGQKLSKNNHLLYNSLPTFGSKDGNSGNLAVKIFVSNICDNCISFALG